MSAPIDLTTIAGGTGGFVILGRDAGDNTGFSVASAGDVNGDGFDDLILGAYLGDASGNSKSNAGDSYLIFGKASGFTASIDLTAVAAGTGGFVIYGQDIADNAGISVASAGDINGDGFDDLLIGAQGGDAASNAKGGAGDSYVIFGKASAFAASVDLTTVAAGTGGFVIYGQDASDQSGYSLASAGDINGDGFADLIIGARLGDGAANLKTGAGDTYIVFGKASGFGASIDLTTIAAGTGGFVVFGNEANDNAGGSVAAAGDVNGDGYGDLIIGARFADGVGNIAPSSGEAYVLFGKASGFAASADLSALAAGTGGFTIYNEDTNDRAGASVASAGDINGDGFDDLVIGVAAADGAGNAKSYAGDTYVVFGKSTSFGGSISLSSIASGSGGFVIYGQELSDQSGFSVASAGDVNGDGFDDLIIGARFGDAAANAKSSAGDSYVVFGKASGFGAAIDLSTIAGGTGGFVIYGQDANDQSGTSVASAGDINGDGFDDLIVGSPFGDAASNAKADAGDSYVIFGKAFDVIITHPGTTAADTLTGTANADIMIGGLGNDTLSGAAGADALRGGAGDDSLIGGAGADRIDGGLGRDTADYGASALAVTVNLATSLNTGGDALGDQLGDIENVSGSAFNDSLTGDALANVLSGAAGNDTLVGGRGNDTISGGAGLDTAIFSGLKSSYTITKSAGSVTVSGADGIDVLTGVEKLQFSDAAVTLKPAVSDFNADANSDLLWFRQSDGYAYLWTLANNVQTGGNALAVVGSAWTIQTTGDFNGDGSSDFVWKNTSTGQFYIWNFVNGVQSGGADFGVVGTNWNVMGSGDFNADGTSDVVWRDSNTGQLYLWMLQNNAIASSTDLGTLGVAWTVQAVGDFNGDGTSDLALRNTTTGQAYLWNFSNGALSGGASLGNVGTNWTIMGAGDFNANGTDDLAWRNSADGNLYLWMMQNNTVASASGLGAIGSSWTIDAISDVNADATSDLLLKNSSSGQFYIWNITNGAVSGGADLGVVGADWQLI